MPIEKQKNIIYPKIGIKDVLSAFWNGIKPQKWALFFLTISIVLANIVGSFYAIFYKKFFDIISVGGDKNQIALQLVVIITQIAILNGIVWIFIRIFSILLISFEAKTMARLRQQAYDYLIKHSYSFFTNNFAGSLVQRVNRFARAFETLSDQILWAVLPLFVKIISVIIILLFINKWIALTLLIWVLVFLSFNVLFSRWKVKYDIKVAEMDSKSTGYLSDTISNQNTIQLFNGFNFEYQGYKKVTDEQAKAVKFSWNLDAVMEGTQALLGIAIEFLLFYFTIKYWQKGLVTVGVFVMLQAYILNLIDQLWGFSRVVRSTYQAYADSKEIVEIMKLQHGVRDIQNAKEIIVQKGEIEFKDLTFSFLKETASAPLRQSSSEASEASASQARKVLEDINLKINAGEKVALIGPSGAGKTTFVRLLLRLYSPTSGKILIDGQDILSITQGSLRENISMVPQDPILFHRTLLENIAYGKRGAGKEEITKAAELAHCDEFIKNLPYGLETYVGERGIKLSGGERQRVAIARAILKNAPILVLDEATSSLDSNSEMLIQDALNNLMKDKTTIVIAHRLSTIQKMDRIIVFDNGKIIEQGSHNELLKNKDSLYKKLWELQAGGFLKEDDDAEDQEDTEDAEEIEDGQEEKSGSEAKLANF